MLLIATFVLSTITYAQDTTSKKPEGYKFTVNKQLATTSCKNQASSGTCWSFSTIAFFESELIRMGKGEYDLADMFCVTISIP